LIYHSWVSDERAAQPPFADEPQPWASGPRPAERKSQTNWVRVAIGFFLGMFAGAVGVYFLVSSGDIALPLAVQRDRLQTLDGKPVAFGPTGDTHIVNVWLENCSDCMPHFAAWKSLFEEERLPDGVRVTNVAFRGATEKFARRYHVDQSLVVDRHGRGMVGPLGVSEFTTFVFGPKGLVCFRGQPANAGFAEDLEKAVRRCR